MIRLLAPRALLPEGWARSVLLEVDGEGTLMAVTPEQRDTGTAGSGTSADPAIHRLPGPVVPGMGNVHSHAFQRALAGTTERGAPGGDTFWSWRERMYALLERLDPEAVEAVAAQVYVEMLEAGYTAVGEFHYLHRDRAGALHDDPAELSWRIVTASRTAGIALTHLPALYRTGDFEDDRLGPSQRRFILSVEALVEVLERVAREVERDPDRGVGVALHSLRAVPPDAMRDTLAALDPSLPVHIHAAEQQREVEGCLAWSGARPVEWLLEHAGVDARWCLIHATHMEAGETWRLAGSGAVAGLCPTTEANLGDGVFPLARYLDADGRLAVGSDSQVSVSPVEELRWLEYVQRLTLERRNVAAGPTDRSTGRVLWEKAARGAARALGRRAGTLAPGNRADLVVLDGDHPRLAGHDGDGLLDAWIFSGTVPMVREVWVGGRRVVEEGRHPRREEVAEAYRRTLARLNRTA